MPQRLGSRGVDHPGRAHDGGAELVAALVPARVDVPAVLRQELGAVDASKMRGDERGPLGGSQVT
jgi:hypothetical protein